MNKILGKIILGFGFMISAALFICLSAQADVLNKDYFDLKDRQELILLGNVEKYHLGPEKFWKWYSAGKFYSAIDEIKFVLRYFPNHPNALELLGFTAKLNKTPSLAIPYFENALSLYPQYGLTHAQYGKYLVEIGRLEEGITRLKKAIEIDPKLAVAYEWLSKAYSKSGDMELGRQAAEKAKELGYKGKAEKELKNNETER